MTLRSLAGVRNVPRTLELLARVKILAAMTIGFEEAVGYGQVGGLANMFAQLLYKELDLQNKDIVDVFNMLNKETVFRLDAYSAWKGLVRDEGGKGKAFYLVGRECPVRQILYQEGLPPGRLLCNFMCTFLEKIFSEKLGGKYKVSLALYGPNACLLRVAIASGSPPPENFISISEEPSVEEYANKLLEMYDVMIRAVTDALYKLLGNNPAMGYRIGKAYGIHDGEHTLAEIGITVGLESAVEYFNEYHHRLVELELDKDILNVRTSLIHNIVDNIGLEHSAAVYRVVQGYIAGVLSALTGKNIDARAIDEKARKLKLYVR